VIFNPHIAAMLMTRMKLSPRDAIRVAQHHEMVLRIYKSNIRAIKDIKDEHTGMQADFDIFAIGYLAGSTAERVNNNRFMERLARELEQSTLGPTIFPLDMLDCE